MSNKNRNESESPSAEFINRDSGRKELISKEFLLQTIPGAAIVYKMLPDNLEVVACSRGLCSITGWEADEFCQLMKDKNFKLIHPADELAFQKLIDKIIRIKTKGELIYRGYKKDGSTVWLWFQGQYAGEEDNCPLIEGLILDVSNNTNTYQTILDQSQSIVTVVDAHTFEALYANQAAKNIVSHKLGEFVGNICYQYVYGLDKPCKFCMVNHTKDDFFVNEELEVQGRYYRQVFKKMLWHGKDAIMEFTSDITEQVTNKNLLAKQKSMQDNILDTIPAGIMVFKFKENGIQIVSANKSILEMMGMDKEKTLGEASGNITSLTHPDDLSIVLNAAKKLSVEGAYVEYEYRHFFRSRNDYIWVLGQGRSVRNIDGDVYAYVNYTDITARKEVEALQSKLETVRIEAAAKAEFYSRMSHDMRTPMNGILGIAALAMDEDDVDGLHRDIEKIQQSGRYMLNLINDTLDLQRMETKRMKLEPQIVRCQDMLEEVIAMMMPSIKEKNLDLKVNILENSEMNCYVKVDALRLKQIVVNILSNSVKYTHAGGTIELCVGELKREQMISHDVIRISDNGVGMSKDFLQHGIFKPFSQERNEMSMQYPGSGLGLSIVKQLIELMGGSIEVESNLGVGTFFSIYFDLEMISDEEARKIKREDVNVSKCSENEIKRKRLLLCEDHPLNAEITQRLLQKVGCSVEWAEDGSVGVYIFKKSAPGYFDAILMDIRMPVMDGLDAARAIRLSNHIDAKKVPIIAMSANAYEEDIRKSLEVGMNDYLAKPINPQMLFRVLAKYLGE